MYGIRGVTGLNTTGGATKMVTYVDDNNFTLQFTTGSGTYISGTGYWGVWAADTRGESN